MRPIYAFALLFSIVAAGCATDQHSTLIAFSAPSKAARLQLAPAPSLTGKRITAFALPASFDGGPVALGPDGNVWVGETQNTFAPGSIARITPDGSMTVFEVGGQGGPSAIASANGALWFPLGGEIAKMSTSGSVTLFSLPHGTCVGRSIVQGPDRNVWFADGCSNSLVRITPKGKVAVFPMPDAQQPEFLTAGSDGYLWISVNSVNLIARSDTSGNVTLFTLPHSTVTREIIDGKDGFVYMVDAYEGNILRVAHDGSSTAFQFGPQFSRAQDVGMALGPSHQIWMVSTAGQMMRFDSTSGTFTGALDLPPGPHGGMPIGEKGIVEGSDADMWFTSGDASGGADYIGVYEIGSH